MLNSTMVIAMDSDEHRTIRYVKETRLMSEDRLEITSVKLSLTRQGRRGIKYTRYFSCWCVEKVGGEPFIKGSRETRVRKPSHHKILTIKSSPSKKEKIFNPKYENNILSII